MGLNEKSSTEDGGTTITLSGISKEMDISKTPTKESARRQLDSKLEGRLNTKDLEALQDAFMAEGDGYDNRLNLNREQFCEALSLILNKGTKAEYGELFDKIDVTKEGTVDWDMFALHMLLEFYERDDRVKSTQVPQWKDLKHLPSPHKEIIQRVAYLKNTNRYIAISKEGCVSMWGQNLKLQRSLKTGTDACKMRDLWVTYFVPLQNVNKIALAFTSKEIAIYDLSTKLEFNCQYKVQGLDHTPLCLDYWSNPTNSNEAIMVWGDTGGQVNALHFSSASIALFERPPAPAGEKQDTPRMGKKKPCLNVQLRDIIKRKYKNARYTRHQGHSEWVRHVKYSSYLECFISCATTWNNSLVIGWTEKHSTTAINMKTTLFQIPQGVSHFDYHETLNMIATAGVNHHVCLWNPYVVSKPNGVLRGHMAGVIQVQFNKARGQLISFSKDKVLRIWDVQLQVCIQRLAGMFPKGPEVTSALFFDEARNKLFITFNYQLTVIEMKPEIKDRVMSHDKPVVTAVYNSTYNQVVSVCQGGTVVVWMIDTGQKVKSFANAHGTAEVTALSQDPTETRLYTGSTDGTIKIWDLNGHCYHILQVMEAGQPADVGSILVLKRSVLAVGWAKYISAFKSQNLKDYHVHPTDWKGGQEHSDDIMAMAFCAPNLLATGSYDGEIVIWNNNSEQASKRLTERSRRSLKAKSVVVSRENTMPALTESVAEQQSVPSEPSHVMTATTQSKSRTASRVSATSTDENNEFSFSISGLLFLEGRNKLGTAANLVSCGGNGFVRFWNTGASALMGEFAAHVQVGSITMTIDEEELWLTTGDTDGVIKVWDIHDYCMKEMDEVWTRPPCLQSQFVAHTDSISSIAMCQRNQRPLVLSSSMDCSVALWDIYGNQIGVFGQEEHWKIDQFIPCDEEEELDESEEGLESASPEVEPEMMSEWEPDVRAIDEPGTFRINIWDNTELGTDYQELRVRKRERRQPQTIPNLPYLHWEKTGQPPAGPYAALDTFNLQQVDGLQKPEFMSNPHKYFTQRAGSANEHNVRLPALAEISSPDLEDWEEGLKAAFDEKTLFPRYILDFEAKMKVFHQQTLRDTTKKAGIGFMRATGMPPNVAGSQRSSSPKRIGLQNLHKLKLKPIKAGSVKDSD